MNWLKSLFTREKWFLIKTYDADITVEGESGRIYFYLFESNKDNRKGEIGHTYPTNTTSGLHLAMQMELYNEVIYPWIHGIDFKEIPSNPIVGKPNLEKPKLKTVDNITYLPKRK